MGDVIERVSHTQSTFHNNGSKMQIWRNGICCIGTIDRILHGAIDQMNFHLTGVERATGKTQDTRWEQGLDLIVCVNATNPLILDDLGFGRVSFALDDRALATLFPPGLNPKEPLPHSIPAETPT